MNLQEIKSKYEGKCDKCGRELRVGWDILYDKDTKKVYCKPCGKTLNNGVSGETAPAQIIEFAPGLEGKCNRCLRNIYPDEKYYYNTAEHVAYCAECGIELIDAMKSPEKALAKDITEIYGDVKLLVSEVAAIGMKVHALTELVNELTKKTKPEKPVKAE